MKRHSTISMAQNGMPSLQTPADGEPSVAAAKAPDGASAVIFVTHGGLLDLDMNRLREGMKAEWFNPLTAERRKATVHADGYFRTPSRDDWVLVLK